MMPSASRRRFLCALTAASVGLRRAVAAPPAAHRGAGQQRPTEELLSGTSTAPANDRVRAAGQPDGGAGHRHHLAAVATDPGRMGHRVRTLRWLLIPVLAAWACVVGAQQAKVPRIGVLANAIPTEQALSGTTEHPAYRALMEGLRERGWTPGKNVEIVFRSAEGDFAKLPGQARDLAADCDVILAWAGPALAAVMAATSRVPIVAPNFSVTGRLEVGGVVRVDSLAKPGGNLVGFSYGEFGNLFLKRLELMKLAAPRIRRVGILGHESTLDSRIVGPRVRKELERLGLELFAYSYRSSPDRIEAAFEAMARDRIDAVYVEETPAMHQPAAQALIHRLAERRRMATMHEVLGAVDSGGLLSYGPDILKATRRATYFVDRILRGAKPAELPIEQATEYELRVNLGAARALGLTLPQLLLLQATRIVE